ncbi:MAG: LysR family transcriptional regulator [Aliiglaciecola sp.]|uniref:LysR family transcriptional regulator n=1 Tax=Aliiglaciecola sp. TaxID=1872441 RepID=UPI003297C891
MNYNLRHLLCALEIKQSGKLSVAAKSIHLSQSALTQGINKLESSLGELLFIRAHSGMFPTASGERFLLRVERAFQHLQNFANALFANDKGKRHSFIRSVTIRQLNSLINIAELESYTAAAARMHLTQPTLHRAIKDLENLCEQTLFTRTPSGVEPNWRARQLRRYASLFFAELHQGIVEIGEQAGRMDGSISIGSLPLARTEIVPQCVLQLVKEFPDAQVSVIDGPYEEQLHALLHGQLDMIVGALRFPTPHEEIVQHSLFDDQLSIVVKAQHPLANRKQISNAELQALKWVAPSHGAPARQVFTDLFKSRGIEPPSQLIECSGLVTIRGILLGSERAALLPARQVDVEVKSGLLAVCPMPLVGTNRQIGLSTRKNWKPTLIQQRLIDIIGERTVDE